MSKILSKSHFFKKKMVDFLFDTEHGSMRLFCTLWAII